MPARCTILLALLFFFALGSARTTAAAPAATEDAGADELTALEQQLALGAAALAGGCPVACPALASMQRAAARICALDPGPRCTDARAKVRDATRRVREACPECPAGAVDAPPSVQAAVDARRESPPPAPPEAQLAHAAPPRGGCAGCTVGAGGGLGGAGALAALGALSAMARRRARTRRRGARSHALRRRRHR